MEDRGLETTLDGGGDVTVAVVDRATGFAPFAEQLAQRTQSAAVCFPFLRRVLGEERDLVRPSVAEFDHLPHLGAVALRVAVRRESHHLVLVHHHLEAQVERENAVQDPERLSNRVAPEHADRIALADRDGEALDLAHAIRDDDERIVEATEIEGTGGMGEVVRNANEARAPAGKDFLRSPGCHLRCVDLVVPTLPERPLLLKGQRPVGEAVCDAVDVGGLEPGRLEAVQDCIARKRPR